MLEHEEYIEQAYLFRAIVERGRQNVATQDLLQGIKEEILASSKLPMAIDFMISELKLAGGFSTAMRRLPHYFTSFQTFLVGEAEDDSGRFDFYLALELLRREAEYRATGITPQGLFLFQLECLSRNRLRYDKGLDAMAEDPIYDEVWRNWIQTVRRQVGLVDLADLIYVRSQYFVEQQEKLGGTIPEEVPLFGAKEGQIAFSNRRKDPLFLFAALQRQLGYPEVPRRKAVDETPQIVPQLSRRVERLEQRIKLLEEEQKGGLDITKFYGRPDQPPSWSDEPPEDRGA